MTGVQVQVGRWVSSTHLGEKSGNKRGAVRVCRVRVSQHAASSKWQKGAETGRHRAISSTPGVGRGGAACG